MNTLCGKCGTAIDVGDPMLVVTIPGVRRKPRRCTRCEGPVPVDLPSLEEFKRIEAAQPVFLPGVTPRLPLDDWAGYATAVEIGREPGEEE